MNFLRFCCCLEYILPRILCGMTDAPFHVWIHIAGTNGDVAGNEYESQERAERTGRKRVDDPSNTDVIAIDARRNPVNVRVLKGAIDPFRVRLAKVFAEGWQQEANTRELDGGFAVVE